MELNLYTNALAICAVITLLLTIRARSNSGGSAPLSADFKRFQYGFLAVYYVAMTADWLQGPYVYALYASYGFSKPDIAVLFVGGFGASMLFGTFIGAAADKMGRKKLCLVYCVLYLLSCATKHGRDYWVLMVGRVLGGVATSLLFSSFESWMVCEHNARGYDSTSLSDTFSLMYFGNSLCAILAGMMAEGAADAVPLTKASGIWHYGGYCSPFDLSAAFLVLGFALIISQWGGALRAPPSRTRPHARIRAGTRVCTPAYAHARSTHRETILLLRAHCPCGAPLPQRTTATAAAARDAPI